MSKYRPRAKKQVDDALAAIENMHSSSAFTDDIYHKCLVSIAFDYFCANEQQEALIQLARVPVRYYKDIQPGQMREDRLYGELVVLLSYKLIQMGVVDGSERFSTPTMAPARA